MVAPAIAAAGISAAGSIIGGLFGKKKSSAPKVYTAKKTLTPRQFDYMNQQLDLGSDVLDESTNVYEFLKENPQVLEGMSPEEVEAMDRVLSEGDRSGQLYENLYGEGSYMGDLVGDPAAAMEGIYDRYENPYLEDVVGTTMSGMQRQAAREAAERGAQTSASGGMTNTRAAVADALAQQLTGMNMAEMEAKLRSDAFTSSREMGMDEARLVGDQTGAIHAAGESDITRQMDVASLLKNYGAEGRKIRDTNAEAERLAGRDALNWYDTIVGPPDLGRGNIQAQQDQQNPWLTGLGMGTDLAASYLEWDRAAPTAPAAGTP